jgi:hypothetical protein
VRRDFAELQDAGFEIEISNCEHRSYACLHSERAYSTVPITKRERFTLLAVRSVFEVLHGTPFLEDVGAVMQKLEQRMSVKERAERDAFGERFMYMPDHGSWRRWNPHAARGALRDHHLHERSQWQCEGTAAVQRRGQASDPRGAVRGCEATRRAQARVLREASRGDAARGVDGSHVGRPLVGRYRDPALGTVEIRATATGAVFDVGEWQTAIDREIDPDGTVKLILLDPPFAGCARCRSWPTLLVPGQTSYTFVRT